MCLAAFHAGSRRAERNNNIHKLIQALRIESGLENSERGRQLWEEKF